VVEKQEALINHYEETINQMMETETKLKNKLAILMKALETDDEICTIQGELVEGMFK
jgi:hypothetical protein